tara:strand:- start:233 stop:460 length:228 start_codon:yes stop_codon:yes gene_type:complete
MRVFVFISLILITNACSLNSDSKYWSEDNINRINSEIELNKIINKSNDIYSMTFNEYEIFIKDYTKKSKYPKVNN